MHHWGHGDIRERGLDHIAGIEAPFPGLSAYRGPERESAGRSGG